MSVKFAYRGTELPNQEMIDWFNYSFNKPPDNMDGIESSEWSSKLQDTFFEQFEDELRDLSYMEMLDVLDKSMFD